MDLELTAEQIKKMTYDEWVVIFKPQVNHILGENSAPIDGYMFETYDQEIDYVKTIPSNRIWTVLDGDDDNLWLVSGIYLVNRMGYIITEVSFKEGSNYNILIN